jgi:DNA-binding NtrC family response regulator
MNVDQALSRAASSAWPVDLAGASPAARRLRARARELSQTARPVLILAARGFDAVAVADRIHALGGDLGRLVHVSCGSDSPVQIESRLFGSPHPHRARGGNFEIVSADGALVEAQHGTLVLESIHDLPVSAQTRLARVLRDGEARCANGTGLRPLRLELRVVATTDLSSDELGAEVRQGRFRADLMKRFATRELVLVPLRDRRDDIGPIAATLMAQAARGARRVPRRFTEAALALLGALAWDGNIAALDQVVRELAAQETERAVRVEDVLARLNPAMIAGPNAPRSSLREARRQFEREYIAAVLEHSGWRMGQAARLLGIQRTNLYRKARQLGIERVRAEE